MMMVQLRVSDNAVKVVKKHYLFSLSDESQKNIRYWTIKIHFFKVTVNVCDSKFGFRSLKAELLTESR